jgi:hypothetical protein
VRGWGIKFTEKPWPDWWYFGKERRLVRDSEVDDEVDQVGLSTPLGLEGLGFEGLKGFEGG